MMSGVTLVVTRRNDYGHRPTSQLRQYLEEQLEILAEWDADELIGTLGITTEEVLEVPAFRNRAEQWIKDNCP